MVVQKESAATSQWLMKVEEDLKSFDEDGTGGGCACMAADWLENT